MNKGYIYDAQQTLFGAKEIIGFGNDAFCVKEIARDIANQLIIKNHYSHKVFNNSYIHLGVFINGKLLGVLQYGHLMNNNSVGNIVEGTKNGQALELNRMWLDDEAKRNSESKAVSYSTKYIKGKYRHIKWIQSFADERCGGFGIVYQACSFFYYGEHMATFYELDGVYYHNIVATADRKKAGKAVEIIKGRIDDCKKVQLRQFRYIKYIDAKWRKKCLLKEMPYVKHYKD